jgi:hypothetical protein
MVTTMQKHHAPDQGLVDDAWAAILNAEPANRKCVRKSSWVFGPYGTHLHVLTQLEFFNNDSLGCSRPQQCFCKPSGKATWFMDMMFHLTLRDKMSGVPLVLLRYLLIRQSPHRIIIDQVKERDGQD